MNHLIQSVNGHDFVPFNSVGGPIQEAVLPLIAKVDDRLWPVGTAFVIYPGGLLLTARHVLEEAERHAIPRQRSDGSTYRHYELYALYMSSSRAEGIDLFGGSLPVDELWCADSHDVAIVRVNLPRHVETDEPLWLRSTTILGTRPPRVGSPVAAIGYCKMTAEEVTEGTVDYSQETAISTGRVTEVFHQRRDGVLATYPCFHVDCRFDSGMSGGPILDDRGRVCGIVSRGLTSADEEHTGLGASIWPALGIPIQLHMDGTCMTTNLLELARRQLIALDETDARVEVVNGQVRVLYNAAEEWKPRHTV